MCPCLKTVPLAPIHPFTKQIVPSLYHNIDLKLVDIHGTSFPQAAYKLSPPSIAVSCMCHLNFFVSFLLHTSWACVNPASVFSNSLFVHSFVCPITHSFINGFQSNLYQHFFNVCSTSHTISTCKKHLNVFNYTTS